MVINTTLANCKGIKLAHFNIRSLWPKIDTFRLWLEEYNLNVITLSETWLSSDIPSAHLDLGEYEISRLDRTTGSRGGGLLTLVKKSGGTIFDIDKYKPLCISNRDAEIQISGLKLGHAKKMLITNCYRPPSGKVDQFIGSLLSILDQIPHLDEFEILICGDFNIPYNKLSSPGYKKLRAFESKYNLTQTINCQT